MKKALLKWGLIGTVLLFSFASLAQALTLSGVDGTWSNVVGGHDVNFPTSQPIVYGNGLEDQVRWGDPVQFESAQSGLGFTGISPPASTFNIGDDFEIGQLRHFNAPIWSGSQASAADLGILLTFTDPLGLNGTFAFTFAIDETPNPAPDIITFPLAYPPQTFNIGGIDYTLHLLGFGNSPSTLVSQFISPEGSTNSTRVWGEITTPAAVPEPATLLLLGSGLLGLAGHARKRMKK